MTRSRRATPRAPLRTALLGVAALILIAAAAWLGVLIVDRIRGPSIAAETPTPTPVATLPSIDVAGDDVAALGRFPGAVRTAYDRERQGATRVTIVEYVAAAAVDDVRAFYRRLFRENGWELIELDVAGGEWTFLVERGGRAALVEIEDGGTSTLIQIEVEAPIVTATPRPTPTPRPPPPPQPPPPPPGDDDDGGDDDDDDGTDD